MHDVTLIDAAAAVLLEDAPPGTVASALHEGSTRVDLEQGLLTQADTDGRWWPYGLLSACSNRRAIDSRLDFLDALPRSMAFGTRLAQLCTRGLTGRDAPPDALEVARLVNLFVTLFDGLCDERPDLLPMVLPAVRDHFASFPVPQPPLPPGEEPLPRLVDAIVIASFSTLADPLRRASLRRQARIHQVVNAALATQMQTLVGIDPGHATSERAAAIRTRVSIATLQTTLELTALLAVPDDRAVPPLEPLAEAAGALCGWIDDLADLEVDRQRGRTNAVQLLAFSSADIGPPAHAVARETARRWAALTRAANQLPHPADVTEPLRQAMLAWVGAPQPLPS